MPLPLLVALGACDSPSGCRAGAQGTAPTSTSESGPRPEIVAAPRDIANGREWVLGEAARARGDGRKLVIYVGATWCDPCVRFHDAVLAGHLDRELAGVRLLELDADRHERLLSAGDLDCRSELIPLFARPTEQGRCAAERVAGAIKGDGAVGFLLPKLRKLLDGPS